LLYSWNPVISATVPTAVSVCRHRHHPEAGKTLTWNHSTELTQALRKQLAQERSALLEQYQSHRDPQRYLSQHSQLVDSVLQQLWQHAGLGEQASMIAVGGYGRGQLFPSFRH
jgi:UTP:GlnB (protein PII) uridylyltransferase